MTSNVRTFRPEVVDDGVLQSQGGVVAVADAGAAHAAVDGEGRVGVQVSRPVNASRAAVQGITVFGGDPEGEDVVDEGGEGRNLAIVFLNDELGFFL